MIYPEKEQTHAEVENHYDSLDPYYRKLWGEHVHHGYWIIGNETVEQATENLIELVAKKGAIDEHTKVLDVGCGYGATARYLVATKEAQVTALTISKTQWQYARTHDPESSNPKYILGDFLHNDFKEGTFDVVLSIESSEHMAEKEKFFSEMFRLLKPGGRLIVCAWLAKENPSDWEIQHFLRPICTEGRLPSMGSETEYREMISKAGFEEMTFEDVSKKVKKTWAICAMRVAKALFSDKKTRGYLFNKHSPERAFAKTLFRIWGAYQSKAMRYGIFTATKPRKNLPS